MKEQLTHYFATCSVLRDYYGNYWRLALQGWHDVAFDTSLHRLPRLGISSLRRVLRPSSFGFVTQGMTSDSSPRKYDKQSSWSSWFPEVVPPDGPAGASSLSVGKSWGNKCPALALRKNKKTKNKKLKVIIYFVLRMERKCRYDVYLLTYCSPPTAFSTSPFSRIRWNKDVFSISALV